jgi:hypothetical protein
MGKSVTLGGEDAIPVLSEALTPPLIQGGAALSALVYAGQRPEELLRQVSARGETPEQVVGAALDAATLCFLGFRREAGLALQNAALDACQIYRVASSTGPAPLRVLALVAPGDLQVNIPLDFITAHLDVRLDLLFVRPGQTLPACAPDHDVAIFAVSESDRATLRRLAPLFRLWPRPVVNDPARVPGLGRLELTEACAGLPGLLAPALAPRDREALLAAVAGGGLEGLLPGGAGPVLVRPEGSHAGEGLALIADAAALGAYLAREAAPLFFVSRFIDYRSADGLFRKYRVAFISGRPFLCHMAVSSHWMVHYLNAGMTESAAKRADEARAMAEFDAGFAARHRDAFAALCERVGLDYFVIDCAEAPDGRLLLFEADVAAIIHLIDPPDLFPYKTAQMRRAFDAFGAFLAGRARGGGARLAAMPEETGALLPSAAQGRPYVSSPA